MKREEKTMAEKIAWGVLKVGFFTITAVMSAAIGKSTKKLK